MKSTATSLVSDTQQQVGKTYSPIEGGSAKRVDEIEESEEKEEIVCDVFEDIEPECDPCDPPAENEPCPETSS